MKNSMIPQGIKRRQREHKEKLAKMERHHRRATAEMKRKAQVVTSPVHRTTATKPLKADFSVELRERYLKAKTSYAVQEQSVLLGVMGLSLLGGLAAIWFVLFAIFRDGLGFAQGDALLWASVITGGILWIAVALPDLWDWPKALAVWFGCSLWSTFILWQAWDASHFAIIVMGMIGGAALMTLAEVAEGLFWAFREWQHSGKITTRKDIDAIAANIAKQPVAKVEPQRKANDQDERFAGSRPSSKGGDQFGFDPSAFGGGPQKNQGPNKITETKPDDEFWIDIEKLERRKQRHTPGPQTLTALDELNSMIGLDPVKDEIKKLRAMVLYDQKRAKEGAQVTPQSRHMVFTGNPGTGKTTVARVVAKALFELGVLSKPTVVEVTRQDLVGEYIGKTAPKTTAVIKRALDGVLFIDEAYSLSGRGTERDYGPEAIETLLAAMENNRDRLVVIVAGYKDKMEQFISSNAGLKSRFRNTIQFPDYKGAEMFQIFLEICQAQDFSLDQHARPLVQYYLHDLYENRDENFGNGRDVRNLFETCVQNVALRTEASDHADRETLLTITAGDVPTPASLQSDSLSMKYWVIVQSARSAKAERERAAEKLIAGTEKADVARLTDGSDDRKRSR